MYVRTTEEPGCRRLVRVIQRLQPGWTIEFALKRALSDLRTMRHARIHANLPVEAFAVAYARSYAQCPPGAVSEPERRALELEIKALLVGEVT